MKLIRRALALLSLAAALNATAVLAAEGDSPTPSEGKPPPKDLVLKGDAKCTACHDEADAPELLRIGKTRHGVVADGRTPTCTNCHGPSEDHLNYKGSEKPPKPDVTFGKKSKTEIVARNAACLNCHEGGNRNGWMNGTHGTQDIACTNCHQVHTQHDRVRDKNTQPEVCFTCHKEQRNQVNKAFHHPVIEGKMTCSSCHNVHSSNPKHLVKASTNETCYTCHMEKRGPFVHNHQPVTEDCAICHQPHGTNIASLLKARPPFLCQDCHSHDSHPGQAAGLPTGPTNSTSLLGSVARGCLNCHTNIHGGNSTVNSGTAGRFRR